MDTRPTNALPPPATAPTRDDAKISKASKDFESVVIAELIRPMFESLDADGLGGGGDGERMFRPMLVEQYAKRLVDQGGIGLADAVARELMTLQARRTE